MISININGLSLCHKGSGGISHNTLPDVCKTPSFGIPVPYENEAYSQDLLNGTISVFADGANTIANLGSQFSRSIFDEQGIMGGVKSGTNRAEAEWISHSFDVFFEKKPACRLTDKMWMNHRNTVNMAGECQDALSQKDIEDELCRIVVECYKQRCNKIKSKNNPDGKYKNYQGCVDKKIKDNEKNYDKSKRAQKDNHGSNLWSEVSFKRIIQQGVADSFEMVMGGGGKLDVHSSNPYTPEGGRRMDVIWLKCGNIEKLYDMKFPKDSLGSLRKKEYRRIARILTGKMNNYITFDTRKCSNWPSKCPNPTPSPSPKTDKQMFEALMAEAKRTNNIELQNQLLKNKMYWNLSDSDRLKMMGAMAAALAVGATASGTVVVVSTASGTTAVTTIGGISPLFN